MIQMHRWLILLCVFFIVFIAMSIDFIRQNSQENFDKWKEEMFIQLQEFEISDSTLDIFVEKATFDSSIIDDYYSLSNISYNISFNEDLLLKSQQFYKQNKTWLDNNENEFNILSEVVIAMYAVNSHFGQKIGKNKAIDVLSTLAYHSDSQQKYQPELVSFLRLLDKKFFDVNVPANNDGTFTYIGVMPTIYEAYGVDADGDNIIDLFSSKEDIIATSFRVLQVLGLNETTWGDQVLLPVAGDFHTKQGIQYLTTVDKWINMGLSSYHGTIIPQDNRSAFLLMLDSPSHGILLYNNFSVISKTNGNNIQKTMDILIMSDKISEYKKAINYSQQKVIPAEEEIQLSEYNQVERKPTTKKDDIPSTIKDIESYK